MRLFKQKNFAHVGNMKVFYLSPILKEEKGSNSYFRQFIKNNKVLKGDLRGDISEILSDKKCLKVYCISSFLYRNFKMVDDE